MGKRFITMEAHLQNVQQQIAMNKNTIAQIKETENLTTIDLYFYSDQMRKLTELEKDLTELGYDIDEIEPSENIEDQFMLSGSTTEFRFEDLDINLWTTQMCNLGFARDCEFSGWETFAS